MTSVDITTVVTLVAITGASLALILALRRREKRDTATLAESVAHNLHIPQTMHPVIDPDICIGSLSCLKACPEGDILGIVDGRAALTAASNCIGHGKCALECPVGAIKLVFGTSERGVDLPEVDEFFESGRPGVHVVGELGGMGLIRNAVTQGLQVAEALRARIPKGVAGDRSTVDVAIVGAGPAGLATALGCRAAGLSYRLLEQEALGGTIATFPRQKVVMTEQVTLPIYGKFGKRLISKEELLATWQEVITKAELRVHEGVKVTGLEGDDGAFQVLTTKGTVQARKVVLATGRRGSPRKLGALGENLPKVSYRLIDPEQYEGCRVLVVGGGDAALEAAIQLAEQSDAEVSLSYRGEALGKCREANRKRFEELVRQKRIRALMASQVKEVRPDEVVISMAGGETALPNDYVIVNIGGELPVEFLSKLGVGLHRHHGAVPADRRTARAKRGSAKDDKEARKSRRFAFALFTLGALIVAGLAVVGGDYYLLPKLERLHSPMHAALKPAGWWGHGVGIIATAFMLSNFLYAVRKRWRLLKGAAPIRRWLTFHMFVGFMSPLTIVFHAAFQSNNMLATGTALSLIVVVGTGAVGRFIYGLIPTQDGRQLAQSELLSRWERLRTRLEPLLCEVENRDAVRTLLATATAPPHAGSLIMLFLKMPGEALSARWRLWRARSLFPGTDQHADFRDAFLRLSRLRTQVGFYRGLKRLLSVWRALHMVLAIFLVVVIAAHVAVSLFLGYRWIF